MDLSRMHGRENDVKTIQLKYFEPFPDKYIIYTIENTIP